VSRDPFARIRAEEYPEPEPRIFLNAASYGLLPRRTAEAVTDLVMRRNLTAGFQDREWGAALWRARTAASHLLRCPMEDVALAPNTSFGVNLAAHAVAQGPRGEIVLSEGEFPTNVFPWLELQARGFSVRRIPTVGEGLVDEEGLLEAVRRPGVRALAVSAVQFHTGCRVDLRALGEACRTHGVLFAVDGIQALGLDALYPSELGVDVMATGGQKWLCAPWGTGFVYVSPELRASLRPQVASWLAYESTQQLEGLLSYDMALLPDARRFELHTLGVHDFLGLAHSLELFLELEPERVREYIRSLQEPVLRWVKSTPGGVLVTPANADQRGGILAFRLEGGLEPVADSLRAAGVAFAVREGAIRLAPHFYNTPEQMERVVQVMESALA
jgi:selenocysteine lyase/cysteine desulfurase